MNESELNEKLAVWAGFKPIDNCENDGHSVVHEWRTWRWPDGKVSDAIPDFLDSLDDCFKWLVPKLDFMQLQVVSSMPTVFATAEGSNGIYSETARTAAVALCSAIERVIDGGAK